jgi:hypothetical protein
MDTQEKPKEEVPKKEDAKQKLEIGSKPGSPSNKDIDNTKIKDGDKVNCFSRFDFNNVGLY